MTFTIMGVTTSLTHEAVAIPLDLGDILVTILVAPEAIIKLNRIHAFEYVSWFHGCKGSKNL